VHGTRGTGKLGRQRIETRLYPSFIGFLGYCPGPKAQPGRGGMIHRERLIRGRSRKRDAAEAGILYVTGPYFARYAATKSGSWHRHLPLPCFASGELSVPLIGASRLISVRVGTPGCSEPDRGWCRRVRLNLDRRESRAVRR
jgi:hypothetical protein